MNFIKALGTVAFFTMAATGCSTSNEYLDLSNPVRVVAEESNGPTVCVSDVLIAVYLLVMEVKMTLHQDPFYLKNTPQELTLD